MECTVKTDAVLNSYHKIILLLLTKEKNVSLKNASLHFAASVCSFWQRLGKIWFSSFRASKSQKFKLEF